ncbi:MAG TPA: hypothetical protein VFS67_27705 [Polyangiaceae bacterium]|nr:hypothetical protein [Polyangiaceae bacterium]
MNQIALEALQTRAVRICRAAPLLDRAADQLIASVRQAMGVPEHAEAEVEQEFAGLRATLQAQFLPEFGKIYTALLLQQLGAAASVVLRALESEPVQAYLAAAEPIEAAVNNALHELSGAVSAALSDPGQG